MQVVQLDDESCAFGVSSGKFWGFIVHRKWVDIDLAKAKTIWEMEPPKTVKIVEELFEESFLHLSVYSYFAELLEPF